MRLLALAAVDAGIWRPLLLSTLAGLSTSIGAVLAVMCTPDEGMLAFLLGTAIGVMATVSCVELWWHKAVEQQGWLGVTAAVAAGALAFALLDPLLPKPPEPQQQLDWEGEPAAVVQLGGGDVEEASVTVATALKRHPALPATKQGGGGGGKASGQPAVVREERLQLLARPASVHDAAATAAAPPPGAPAGAPGEQQGGRLGPEATLQLDLGAAGGGGGAGTGAAGGADAAQPSPSLSALRMHHSGLMRLGLLMAVTMVLHNLPEGFAVAFSTLADGTRGLTMALAIAVHNVPEGVIIAVPIYAATGSAARACLVAASSGLSEPVGALLALFLVKPFVTTLERLDYVLAFVGGVMLAVCGLELWPEARRCRRDARMAQGILLGCAAMAWTLWIGV